MLLKLWLAMCGLLALWGWRLARRRKWLGFESSPNNDYRIRLRAYLMIPRQPTPTSASGRPNGRAPTSRPPSALNPGGEWTRGGLLGERYIAGFFRYGVRKLAGIVGHATGSQQAPRTMSEQGMNYGSAGEHEDLTR